MAEKRRSATQAHPYTFIFSLYGHYVLPRGGEIWIGSLIRALAALGFSAEAVRTLVSRMKRRGFLRSRRVGRYSFYRLTERGLKEVEWGGGRALSPPIAEWDGKWTVVTYSIPERYRDRRDTLRGLLKWWGFGALAPGTWIYPRPLPPAAEGELRKLSVWEYLEIFRAEHVGPSDPRALVAEAWPQLPMLEDHYRAYIARYEPVLRRFVAGVLSDEECFAAHLQSLIDFVAITLQDPALPPALLPEGWPRPSAQSLFEELKQTLVEPAERFFDEIYETEGGIDVERMES